MKRESDPKDLTVFRSDRYFVVDGKWFFTTREGRNEGPFATADEARQRTQTVSDGQRHQAARQRAVGYARCFELRLATRDAIRHP